MVFDRWDGRYAERIGSVRSSAVRDLFAAASRADIISFAGGMPAIDHVPLEAAAAAAGDAVSQDGVSALQYGSSEGRVETRELVAELNTAPRYAWDQLLALYEQRYGLGFMLVSREGRPLAGAVDALPPTLLTRIKEAPQPGSLPF